MATFINVGGTTFGNKKFLIQFDLPDSADERIKNAALKAFQDLAATSTPEALVARFEKPEGARLHQPSTSSAQNIQRLTQGKSLTLARGDKTTKQKKGDNKPMLNVQPDPSASAATAVAPQNHDSPRATGENRRVRRYWPDQDFSRSLPAKISRCVNVTASLMEFHIARNSLPVHNEDNDEESFARKALLKPLRFADNAGIIAAAITNLLGGSLLAAVAGGTGRLVALVVAAVARAGVFTAVALAGYALELVGLTLALTAALLYVALELGVDALVMGVDAAGALAGLALAMLCGFLLIEIATGDKLKPRDILQLVGRLHRGCVGFVKHMPLAQKLFGESQAEGQPVASIMDSVDDLDEHALDEAATLRYGDAGDREGKRGGVTRVSNAFDNNQLESL